jgi:hypothetical protein
VDDVWEGKMVARKGAGFLAFWPEFFKFQIEVIQKISKAMDIVFI